MTRTARRRWSRELEGQVDGIAFASSGPVLLHGYDPPAGGKWIDSVIPGKLGALDRRDGELLWIGPCEVGYGRGFAAGIVEGTALVLGPSPNGHRIVRMSLANGELLDAAAIPAFDAAHVSSDLCLCASAARVVAIDSGAMVEAWEHAREGERYHHVERSADRAFVVFTHLASSLQGVARLDSETGEFEGLVIAPEQPGIHQIAATSDTLLVVADDVRRLLPALDLESPEALAPGPAVVALRGDGEPGDQPLWFRSLPVPDGGGQPEVELRGDSGKVYVVSEAYIEVLDALSGRPLGAWTVPGLDEQIAWQVVDGAGLVAEESRVSVFELPA